MFALTVEFKREELCLASLDIHVFHNRGFSFSILLKSAEKYWYKLKCFFSKPLKRP